MKNYEQEIITENYSEWPHLNISLCLNMYLAIDSI